MSAPTGLENLARDMGAQSYWLRRLIAVLLDWGICLFALALTGIEPFGFKLFSATVLAGFLLYAYTVIAEYFTGQTIGKIVMGLRVVGVGTKVDVSRLLMREASKLNPVLMLIDAVAGVLLERSGRRRYLEVLSDTTQLVERR